MTKEIKILINEVLISDNYLEIDLPYVVPAQVVAYMTGLGYEHNIDSNGWQHDFWITFYKHNDKKNFIFSGCWYYGGQSFRHEKINA